MEEMKLNFQQHPQGLLVIQKMPPRPVFYFDKLFFSKSRANIAWLFIGYTRVIPFFQLLCKLDSCYVYQKGSKNVDI